MRALTGGIEHLWACESQLDRSLHQLRRSRRKQRMALLKSLRAKRAADERTNDAHVFLQTEGVGNDSLQLLDPARALANQQPINRFHSVVVEIVSIGLWFSIGVE